MAGIEILNTGITFTTAVFTVPTYNQKTGKTYLKYRTSVPYPIYNFFNEPKGIYFYGTDNDEFLMSLDAPASDGDTVAGYSFYKPVHKSGGSKNTKSHLKNYILDIPSKYIKSLARHDTAVFRVCYSDEPMRIYFKVQ